jgi:hypothetical protein
LGEECNIMEAETMTFPSLKIKELVLCSAELGWVIVDPRMFLVSDLLSASVEEIFNFASKCVLP